MSKKILFITTGTRITASSRTRVYNYKPFLEKSGYDVSIIPYNTAIDAQLNAMAKNRSLAVKLSNRINHFFKCVLYLIIVPCYDVIVLQRVLLPKAVFKLIKSLNKKLIFDFDDAIYMADQKKKSFLNNNKFLKRFEYIVKGCDCIVVSNEALKERTNKLNSNVIRIPTSVDTDKLTPSSRGYNGSLVIGWIGSPEGTRYIKSLKEIFEGLFKKFPFLKMKLVGALPLDDWKIDMAVKGWSPKEEVKDLQSFDIGVMALDNDEWSNAKAGYKLLQYMAVGIPCVASTVGVNKEIVEEGITGFLASTPEEWKEKLSILISDVDLRKRMGIAGRMKAERFYSYKVNAPKLAGIL